MVPVPKAAPGFVTRSTATPALLSNTVTQALPLCSSVLNNLTCRLVGSALVMVLAVKALLPTSSAPARASKPRMRGERVWRTVKEWLFIAVPCLLLLIGAAGDDDRTGRRRRSAAGVAPAPAATRRYQREKQQSDAAKEIFRPYMFAAHRYLLVLNRIKPYWRRSIQQGYAPWAVEAGERARDGPHRCYIAAGGPAVRSDGVITVRNHYLVIPRVEVYILRHVEAGGCARDGPQRRYIAAGGPAVHPDGVITVGNHDLVIHRIDCHALRSVQAGRCASDGPQRRDVAACRPRIHRDGIATGICHDDLAPRSVEDYIRRAVQAGGCARDGPQRRDVAACRP